MVELTVLGIARTAASGPPLLLLHDPRKDRMLTMQVGPMEAAAVSAALAMEITDSMPARQGPGAPGASGGASGGALFPRPQTHDLLVAVIGGLRGSVLSIDIQNHIDGAFITEAVIDHPMGRCRLDCRPSDGVVLALRCGAPVRASSAALAQSVDSGALLDILAANDKTMILGRRAKSGLRLLQSRPVSDVVKEAMAGRGKLIDQEARQRIISVARKMLEDEASGQKAPGAPPGRETPLPRIRVSLLRQKKNGEVESLEEYHVPAQGLPGDVIAGLGVDGREAAALSAASDEERWSILLKMLTPETKVPM